MVIKRLMIVDNVSSEYAPASEDAAGENLCPEIKVPDCEETGEDEKERREKEAERRDEPAEMPVQEKSLQSTPPHLIQWVSMR